MKLYALLTCILATIASSGCGGAGPPPVEPTWHFYARSQTDLVICEGTGVMPGIWYGSCGYWLGSTPVVIFAGNSNEWSLSSTGVFTIYLGEDRIDCLTPSVYYSHIYLEAMCSGFGRAWNLYASGRAG